MGTLQAVAAQMWGKGQEAGAIFLFQVAEQLAGALGMGEMRIGEINSQNYSEFILALFSAEVEEGQEAVFSVLRANRNLLDDNFSQVLETSITMLIDEEPEAKDDILDLVGNITNRIQEFPLSNRANNIEIAITGYKLILSHRQPGSEKYAQI